MKAEEVPEQVSWRQAGMLLLAALLGLLLVEVLLRHLPIPLIPEVSRLRMEYNVRSLEQCESGSVLILGDSSTPSAFDTDLLSELLQRPVCLRFLRGPIAMYASYHVLAQSLEKDRVPSMLILMFSPDFWDHPIDVRRLTQVTAVIQPWRFEVLATKAFSYLAINQASESLKQLFLKPGQGFVYRMTHLKKLVAEREKRMAAMGKSDFFATPAKIRGIPERDLRRADEFTVEAFHFDWLERIFGLAARADIPVVFAQGPILRDYLFLWPKKLRQQREALRAVVANYPQVLLHANGFYYRIGYRDTWDTHWHLHERERGNFTRSFVEQLQIDLRARPEFPLSIQTQD